MDQDPGCCAVCGRRLTSSTATYCRSACRQRAYRQRHETGGAGDPPVSRAGGFVGRVDDIRRLTALLRTERVVTVVGVAGAGKSRLVREVLRDETAWAGVPQHHIDLRNGCPGLDAVPEIEDGVLFLDNTDHRTTALAHHLAYLLARHPRLRVVSAGREAWSLPAEVRYPVEGLGLPDVDNDVSDLRAPADAVRLFIDRSVAEQTDFTANDDNLTLIDAICVRLAGLPLLIEFAAQLTRSLSLLEIAEHACGDLRLLGGGRHGDDPRHHSWRAALQPSHEALTAGERLCLARIAVLGGSFAAPVAHAVLRDRHSYPEVVAALTRLHDKSLVSVDFPASGTVPARFRLLEPVRLFARETVTARREDETAAGLLTDWVLEETAVISTPCLPAEEQVRRLDPEAGRITTVLAGLLTRHDPRAARLCAAWTVLGRDADEKLSDAVAHFAATLAAGEPTAWAVDLAAARLAGLRGDHDAAVRTLQMAALRAEERAGATPSTRRLLLELSVACEPAGLDAAGHDAAQTCLALSWEAGDEVMAAGCRGRLARHHLARDDAENAAFLLGRALPELAAHRPAAHLAAALNVLGALALERDDVPAAGQHFADALRAADPHGPIAAESMIGLGLCAASTADPRRAVRLLAAGGAERHRSAVTLRWQSRIEQARAAARCSLDDRQVLRCHRAGVAMGRPQAVAYALRACATAAAGPDAEQLSEREWQIVTMVSRGLTNREIAARLFLSVRTIEAHVRAIRGKVGLRSRTEIATWAVLCDPPFSASGSWNL